MSAPSLDSSADTSVRVRREAAVWIARIHSPSRSPQMEAGLRRWLNENPEHQRAFESANELWDTASRIPDSALPRMMRWKRVAPLSSLSVPRAAATFATAALILVAATAAFFYWRAPVLTTSLGEQRIVTLKDGTRVSLNTATRMVVRYDENMRRVQLDSGEALFEVAQNSRWPFVVAAGSREIKALGTSFIVRREGEQTAVTLVDGKISVSAGKHGKSGSDSILVPGERLTFSSDTARPQLDRPKLDKLAAWQRGLVSFDSAPLSEAAAEMNRYSAVKLVIDNPGAAQALISGVFRAGESLSFAQAIAKTYRLDVTEEPGRIVISGSPSPSH